MRALTNLVLALAAAITSSHAGALQATQPRVALLALRDGGIQPQALVDRDDSLHVLYFKGTASAGDLYYAHTRPGTTVLSDPVRVNSIAGSALATGSVRGGQFAIGRNGRIHVAWHGAAAVESDGVKRMPVWYARLASEGTTFEPQVNVALGTTGIDGTTIAADAKGNVYVGWHGQGEKEGEANRTVYVARSADDGAHFAQEEPGTRAATGACGCCGLRATVDRSGTAHVLYRAATDGKHRDATWITLSATSAAPVVLQRWELEACPMSTFAMAQDGDGLIAAWETEQQIYVSRLDPAGRTFSAPIAMGGRPGQKHPSVATNEAGVRLIAWTEGTGWSRGGTLAWQLLDRTGARLSAESNATAVPVWGLVAAVARRDGSFLILH